MDLQVEDANPVVAGDRGRDPVLRLLDGPLVALNVKDGSVNWVFATKFERRFEAKNLHGYPSAAQTIPDAWDIFVSSPAVDNNTVFVGSRDSSLYALDAETGQEKWSFKSGEDPVIHNQVGFQSSPAVVDGMVYTGCRDAHVYAIDAATGRKRWD